MTHFMNPCLTQSPSRLQCARSSCCIVKLNDTISAVPCRAEICVPLYTVSTVVASYLTDDVKVDVLVRVPATRGFFHHLVVDAILNAGRSNSILRILLTKKIDPVVPCDAACGVPLGVP